MSTRRTRGEKHEHVEDVLRRRLRLGDPAAGEEGPDGGTVAAWRRAMDEARRAAPRGPRGMAWLPRPLPLAAAAAGAAALAVLAWLALPTAPPEQGVQKTAVVDPAPAAATPGTWEQTETAQAPDRSSPPAPPAAARGEFLAPAPGGTAPSVASGPPAAGPGPEASRPVPRGPRLLQLVAPGGTRLVWTFSPDFTLPDQGDST